MTATLQSFKWSERPRLSKGILFAVAIGLAGILVFFKLRPYFVDQPRIVTAPAFAPKPSGLASLLEHLSLTKSSTTAKDAKNASGKTDVSGASHSNSDRHGPSIIERPLFDGLAVTLKAVLTTSISSLQPDAPVEATITSLIRDEITWDVAETPAIGARLRGLLAPNLAMKRLGLTFSEMISRDGRTYSIGGSAFDAETKMPGIAANYSSGLPSRLLGVGLDQAIGLSNQVATAKILQNTADSSQVAQEMQAASTVVSQQAANSISNEATQGLRSTPPELSLPAGTEISVRIRGAAGGDHR